MNSQIKTSCLWTYIISVCTASNIGRMHGRLRSNSKSHNKSKFSWASLLFGAFVCIFTTSDSYYPNICFRGLNIDIQQVFIFHSNFKHFVFNVFVMLTNPNTFFGLCEKKAYKDYNIPSMCITKDNLLKTKIARLVWCATQCTLMKNGAICSFVWVITPDPMPWKTKSPSHPG
jgi:hypothetical protein